MTQPRRLGRALADGVLAAAFLLTWISPDYLGRGAYDWLEGVMSAQLASVGLSMLLLYKLDITSAGGLAAAAIVAAVGVMFAFLIGISVINSIGILVPFALLFYTLFALSYSRMPTLQRRMQMTFAFASVVCMILAALIALTIPMPKFGWADLPPSPLVKLYVHDPRSSSHILLAWGTLYFSSITILKYRWRPSWPVPRFSRRRSDVTGAP